MRDHEDLDLQDEQGAQVSLSRQKSMVVIQLMLGRDVGVLHLSLAAAGYQCLKLFSACMTSS